MSEDNVTVMRGAFEAFNRGDIPQVIGVLDPDVVWHNPEAPYPPPAGGGTRLGVDNVVGAIFGPVPETWDAFQAVAERFLDAGDHVIVTGRFTGRANAGGAQLDAPFAMVFEMGAGRVRRVDQYTDTLGVAKALGH
jgi:ketosteroid isomerase-like protein